MGHHIAQTDRTLDTRALERQRAHHGRRALRLFETLSRRRITPDKGVSAPEANHIKRSMPAKSYKPLLGRKI